MAFSEASDLGELYDVETVPEPYESFPDPGFALPGDFLSAHTRSCADFPGQQHGKGQCWCSIAQDTSAEEDSWLLPTGELSARAKKILEDPSPDNINLCDSFGNTALHLFAALGGFRETLLGMVVNCTDKGLWAVNTGGQTFLHLLHLEWFSDLNTPSAPLNQLLAHIRDSCPELVCKTDVYGRTFFHRAHSVLRDPETLAAIIAPFNPAWGSRRDAFGFTPLPTTNQPYIPPRRAGSFSPQVEDLVQPSGASHPRSSADEGFFLAYHARLIRIIHSSYSNPCIEDAEGRNGLHCLAEAIINQQTMDRHVQGVQRAMSWTNRTHLKRKLGSNNAAASAATAPSRSPPPNTTVTTSNHATGSSRPSPPANPSAPAAEATLSARLRHLQALLHPSVRVDARHYDRRGVTPLAAFIEHIPDDHDDRARTLQALLETLVRTGGTGTEARNRRGETPLLVAARLGRKVALATLLELGANPHARDADGRGVLEVLDAGVGSARARADVSLYARLEACRVLLTGRRDWGVSYGGGVCREWKWRGGRSVVL